MKRRPSTPRCACASRRVPNPSLTPGQEKLLATLANGRQRAVREVATGFSGYTTTKGARVETIDALKAAGFITTSAERGSDTYRGHTRHGVIVYAELTATGRNYIGSKR
jgi:hypothetical protein